MLHAFQSVATRPPSLAQFKFSELPLPNSIDYAFASIITEAWMMP
jgi:hypothetical protein